MATSGATWTYSDYEKQMTWEGGNGGHFLPQEESSFAKAEEGRIKVDR